MKRLAFVVIAAVSLLPACLAPNEPALWPEPLLSGHWSTLDYLSPGNFDSLVTQARGGQLRGEWREFRAGAPYASATVSGSYDPAGRLSVRLSYSTGRTASYVAQTYGADSITGVWTDSGPTAIFRIQGIVFHRNPPPSCSNPLPLHGTYVPPLAPTYFVGLRGEGDAMTEAARLAGRYGITVSRVYTAAPQGLSAQLTTAQLLVLRCDASVDSIAFTAWPG